MIFIFFHYTSFWPETYYNLSIIFVLVIRVFVLLVIRIIRIIRIVKCEVLFLVLVLFLLCPCVFFVYPCSKPLVILIAGFEVIILFFVLVFIVLECL